MAKIAVELKKAVTKRMADGTPGGATRRVLAHGDGWSVTDVVCTCGPHDRPFEERHERVFIAIVAAGSFQYHGAHGRALMTPGSLLLGSVRQCFECGHEHGTGDRCISFGYAPDYFDRLAYEAGARPNFRTLRVPPLRVLAPLVARSCAAMTGPNDLLWEEIAVRLAVLTVGLVGDQTYGQSAPPAGAMARVTQTVRAIEGDPEGDHSLGALAREAGLSPFHYLRAFEGLTGLTPHQYILRARLRDAAIRLATEPARVIDIAFDCGFGDVSNFNRAFRAEFGVSPRTYRQEGSRV